MPALLRQEFARTFSLRLEDELDTCHGACVLRQPAVARIVADALHPLDGDRCTLGDFVVMPNRMHLLVGGMARDSMLRQVESWKEWTALQINRALGPFDKLRAGRTGRFWQDESFDHLVRSPAAFDKFRLYIAENPLKAKLPQADFIHGRRPWFAQFPVRLCAPHSNGFTTATPQRVKSSTFLVATVRPCSLAVAAIIVSGAAMVNPLRWTQSQISAQTSAVSIVQAAQGMLRRSRSNHV